MSFQSWKWKSKNHCYWYKWRKLGLLESRINVLKHKTNPKKNSKPNNKQLLQNSHQHPDSRGEKEKSILDFKGSFLYVSKILFKIIQFNGKITNKAGQQCLYYSTSTGYSSGHIYVLLGVFKYLMKDNLYPYAFFLLLTGKVRMKRQYCVTSGFQTRVRLSQPAVLPHSLQPQVSISNIRALLLSAEWANLEAAQFYQLKTSWVYFFTTLQFD